MTEDGKIFALQNVWTKGSNIVLKKKEKDFPLNKLQLAWQLAKHKDSLQGETASLTPL